MTKEQILISIEKERRELNLFEKIKYYRISLLIFTIPSIFLISELLNNRFDYRDNVSIKISLLLMLIAIILFLIKRRDLKFSSLITHYNKNDLKREIESLTKEFEWKIKSSSENYFDIRIQNSKYYSTNSFFELSRFIQVIIIFTSKKILLNVISDIESKDFLTISMGENKQWRKIIIDRLKKANS